MKDLKNIALEINKGKNLEVNFPKYSTGMMNLYHGLAIIKMSMNYYTFYDLISEDKYKKDEYQSINALVKSFNQIIENCFVTDNKISNEDVKNIDDIRNALIKNMNVVTAYVDRLRIYEYVLNRMEYRFKDEEFDLNYYNNDFTNDLMHYILSDKDSVAVNNRILEVVEQLPMRLTKDKFGQYIEEAFSLYKGAQISTVDSFYYNLSSTGMLNEPAELKNMFEDIYTIITDFNNTSFKNIDEDEFKTLSAKLRYASDFISEVANCYVMFASVLNDAYTCMLSKNYLLSDVSETVVANKVITMVAKAFNDMYAGKKKEEGQLLEELTDSFISFEGKQEKFGEIIGETDFAISIALQSDDKILEANNLKEAFVNLNKITKLQSGSDFVELDEELNLEIASDEYVESTCEKLISEFKTSFANMDKVVCRAVMSAVISQMPVFFNNVDEIQGYINVSLLSCTDKAERQACVEILKQIMD